MKFKKPKITKKKVILLVLIALIVVFAASRVLAGGQPPVAAHTTLAKGDLVRSINVSGTISSAESENAYTTLNYPVKEVLVEVGDTVNKGDLLAVLDVSDLSSAVNETQSALNTNKTNLALQLETAKKNYENTKTLFDAGATSQSELDTAYNAYQSAQNNYNDNSSQISLSSKKQQLADSRIVAPISGTVTQVNAVVGNIANGVLFTVEDLSHLEVETELKEYDITEAQIGQKVVIKTDVTGDLEISGKITKLAPTPVIDASGNSTSKYSATVSIEEANSILKVGMNARLSVVFDEKHDVFSVPYTAATINANGEDIIYTAEPQGKGYALKEIPITIGIENDFSIEVSGPDLKEGMIVISDPMTIPPNSLVTIIEDPAAGLDTAGSSVIIQ